MVAGATYQVLESLDPSLRGCGVGCTVSPVGVTAEAPRGSLPLAPIHWCDEVPPAPPAVPPWGPWVAEREGRIVSLWGLLGTRQTDSLGWVEEEEAT